MIASPLPDDALVEVLDVLPDAVLVVDDEGTIIYSNDRVAAMFGYPLDQVIGAPVEALIPEEARADHLADRRAYAVAPRVRPMGDVTDPLVGLRSDGSELPVAISLGPVRWRDRLLTVATVRDATAIRRGSDDALRLRLAAQIAGLGFYDVDPVNDVTSWSPEMYALHDIPPGTPVHSTAHASTLRSVAHPEDVARLEGLAIEMRSSRAQPVYRFEYRIRRRDGEERWLSLIGRTFFGEVEGRHRAVRIIGVVQDVTERKRAELTITEHRRERHALIHDLALESRGLLAAMRRDLDIMLADGTEPGTDSAAVARHRERFGAQVDAMADIVDRMLDATAGEDLSVTVPRRRVLIVADVADVADVIAELLEIQGHDVRVAYDSDGAVAALAEFTPDIVVLDAGPSLDGGSAIARRIREALGSVPVLVALGDWDGEAARRYHTAGDFDRYVAKPIAADGLRALMADIVVHLTIAVERRGRTTNVHWRPGLEQADHVVMRAKPSLLIVSLAVAASVVPAAGAFASGGSGGGGGGGGGTTVTTVKVDTIKVTKAYTNAGTGGGEMLIKAASSDVNATLSAYRPDGSLIGYVQNGGGSRYGGTVMPYQAYDPGTITIRSSSGGSITVPTTPFQI